MSALIRQRGGGVAAIFGPFDVVEHETFTCAHCQRITLVPHKAKAEQLGGICYGCFKLICDQCVGHGCRPIEKWSEEQEARGRMLRDMGY